jgi:hypothetical protein
MNLEDVAISLIEAVDGAVTEKNIEGVIEVFNGIIRGVNNQWEGHLARETEEVLMYDNIICKCGSLIEIIRKRTKVEVRGV